MPSTLFSPIDLRGMRLGNRIVVSPMCQYSADDGSAGDWHLMHLGNLSVSGADLVIVEMTNVEPRARISPYCLGLYSDENEQALARVLAFCRRHSDSKFAVQLGHAGRKASTLPPWEGRTMLTPEEGGWQTVSASAVAAGDGMPLPAALARDGWASILRISSPMRSRLTPASSAACARIASAVALSSSNPSRHANRTARSARR